MDVDTFQEALGKYQALKLRDGELTQLRKEAVQAIANKQVLIASIDAELEQNQVSRGQAKKALSDELAKDPTPVPVDPAPSPPPDAEVKP